MSSLGGAIKKLGERRRREREQEHLARIRVDIHRDDGPAPTWADKRESDTWFLLCLPRGAS